MSAIPATLTQAGSPTRGRGRRLLAASTFKPGELIATFDDPLVAIPGSAHLGTTTCSYCLSSQPGASEAQEEEPAQKSVRACTACRTAAYCSTRCQRADWNRAHKRGECKAFQRARARARGSDGGDGGGGGGASRLLPTPVRALIRLLVLLPVAGAAENEEARAVQGLESHAVEIRGSEGSSGGGSQTSYRDLELQARAALHYLGREPGVEEVQGAIDLLCKLQINSFNRLDADVGQSGLYLHAGLAMVNHSCIPNAFVQFVGRRALLKAYRAIKEGEEVEISYIENTLHRSHRQEELRARYHFDCGCPRCEDDLDVYQVCQKYPHLGLNALSLSPGLESLRNPPIGAPLNSDESLQRNLEEIYRGCPASLQGMDAPQKRRELARRWGQCGRLRAARMFAVDPLCHVLVEAIIYLSERGDFAAALAIACFVSRHVEPYRHPAPFSAQRVKGALTLANILSNTAAASAASSSASGSTARARISELLARTDQVSVCQAIAMLVVRWGPAAHSEEWQVYAQAREMLADIESLPGRERENASVRAVFGNPGGGNGGGGGGGPDERSELFGEILTPIRNLAELALDVLAEEFGP